jgi:hypothetical protein
MPVPPASAWRPSLGVRAAAAAALGLLLLGCGPPTANVLELDRAGFRVTVPPDWDARGTDRSEWADGRTVALIASQPLEPQCRTSGSAQTCTAPVAALNEGGLLVWWLSENCAGAGCEPPDGERLLVGGRPATRISGSHLCDALGVTSERAYLVTVTPQRLDAIVVCERNASEATQAQLRNLLEHVSWRTP